LHHLEQKEGACSGPNMCPARKKKPHPKKCRGEKGGRSLFIYVPPRESSDERGGRAGSTIAFIKGEEKGDKAIVRPHGRGWKEGKKGTHLIGLVLDEGKKNTGKERRKKEGQLKLGGLAIGKKKKKPKGMDSLRPPGDGRKEKRGMT